MAVVRKLSQSDPPKTPLRKLIASVGDERVSMLVTITPEIAADALSRNGINRPVRKTHRAFLARQMTQGQWRPTHQGIAFSPDGELLDGQHRLLAITDARVPIEIMVSFNVPRDAFAVIDYGNLSRTMADVTGFDRKVLEPVAFLYRSAVDFGQSHKIDLDDFAPWWACYGRTARDLLAFCGSARRIMTSAPIRAAAVYVAKATGDDTTPFLAYRSLAIQDYSTMLPSIQSLNRQLLDNQMRNPLERYIRTLLALERQEISRIQVTDLFDKAAEYRVRVKALAMEHEKQVWKIQRPAQPL